MATYVLVHGSEHCSWYWHLVVPQLQALGHDAVAVDLPCADDRAGWAEYADDVVEAVGNRRGVVLVAHSLGAYTAPRVTRVGGACPTGPTESRLAELRARSAVLDNRRLLLLLRHALRTYNLVVQEAHPKRLVQPAGPGESGQTTRERRSCLARLLPLPPSWPFRTLRGPALPCKADGRGPSHDRLRSDTASISCPGLPRPGTHAGPT